MAKFDPEADVRAKAACAPFPDIWLSEPKHLPCFVGTHNFAPEQLNDVPGLLDQLAVTLRELAFRDIDRVLEANTHHASEEKGLRQHRERTAAYPEPGPDGVAWQHRLGKTHRGWCCRQSIFHPEDEPDEKGLAQNACAEKVVHKVDVADVEELDLGDDAALVDRRRHLAQIGRRVDHDLLAEGHRVEVERADVRLQCDDMLDPPFGAEEVGARSGDCRIFVARLEAAARSRGEVDDQRIVFGADVLDHLAVVREIHRPRYGVGMSDVDVDSSGACHSRLQGGVRDLLQRDRQRGVHLRLCQIARHPAGEHRFLHRSLLKRPRCCVPCAPTLSAKPEVLSRPLLDECMPQTLADDLVPLVQEYMLERDDAAIWTGLRLPRFDDDRLCVQGVADEYWLGHRQLVIAEVCHQRAEGGVANRKTNHEGERKRTIHQDAAELALARRDSVQMEWLGIMGHHREEEVVSLGHGPPKLMLEPRPDRTVLKPESSHARLRQPSCLSMRTSRVPSLT